jgi:hypothetical protein
MINSQHALTVLFCKWIVHACEPGESNFKLMLRYRLAGFQPYAQGNWGRSLEWFMQRGHVATSGSRIWGRVTRAWKEIVSEVRHSPPKNYEEWLNTPFWHNRDLWGPHFAKERAAELHQAGIRRISQVWREGTHEFISAEEVDVRFGLRLAEYSSWERVSRSLAGEGGRLRRQLSAQPKADEWLGVFENPRAIFPEAVFQGREVKQIVISNQPQVVRFTDRSCYFFVMRQSCTMGAYVTNSTGQVGDTGLPMQQSFFGFIARVRVQPVTKGPKKKSIFLYYGRIRELEWDPARFEWPKVLGYQQSTDFLLYTTKLGRELLRKRLPPLDLTATKWANTLPANFRFGWSTVWAKERGKKEAGFMWQIWHKAVAVNVWRGRISDNIDTRCPCCNSGAEESIIHRFWYCQPAHQTWEFINNLTCYLGSESNDGPNLNWEQAIFSSQPPARFQNVRRFWALFRGLTLWTLWISRNDQTCVQSEQLAPIQNPKYDLARSH